MKTARRNEIAYEMISREYRYKLTYAQPKMRNQFALDVVECTGISFEEALKFVKEICKA